MPVLDFAYEVQGRLERVSALFPLGRADLTGVLSDVLGSTYFAQQLTCIAADTIVMDFVRLDVALGANDKGTAQCHTLFFDQYLEVSGELDRKSTRLNSSHVAISYAVFCLNKKSIDK